MRLTEHPRLPGGRQHDRSVSEDGDPVLAQDREGRAPGRPIHNGGDGQQGLAQRKHALADYRIGAGDSQRHQVQAGKDYGKDHLRRFEKGNRSD